MYDISSLLAQLEQKRSAFLAFERASAAMLCCESDELQGYMQQREKLVGESDRLDEQIEALLRQAGPQEEALRQALGGRCGWDALPDELRPVYDAAAGTRAIIRRIRELEAQLLPRLEAEKAQLLVKIREINQSVDARAARFSGRTYGARPAGGSNLGRA